jgi:hypothetical protein
MSDSAIAVPAKNRWFRQVEFLVFCTISFVGKSLLLIGLPYRHWPENTFYTCSLLLLFYLYFRFRQGLRAPIAVLVSLAAAVAVDILGNYYGLYGNPFGPLRDYDEFAHFAGSGFSAVGAFWLMRAATLQLGFRVKVGPLALLATSVAFTYCGWYEILELWDEWYWSHFERIHSWHDTPNDLFYDFFGVIVFVAVAALLVAMRKKQNEETRTRVSFGNLFKSLPKNLLSFFVTTMAFSLCAWFEIFLMFDQHWFGRTHFVGFQDCAYRLQWELLACVTLGLLYALLAPARRAAAAESG